MKVSAVAPSNIAFSKYWGRKNETLRLAENGSISMCTSNLLTTTTIEFSENYRHDEVIVNGEKRTSEVSRVIQHLDRIRELAKIKLFAKVVSENNFPTATGLSSSASSFAALTVAAAKAAGLDLNEKELSILARLGSGSACRSIPSGFVEWLDGDTSEASFAKSIFPPSHWEIADVVAVVSDGRKEISTSKAHQSAASSIFLPLRVSKMKQKNKKLKELIRKKDFTRFGELIEAEALELHAIMITQSPPLIYLLPNTILLFKLVHFWRKEGLEVYFTVNTGQDVHLIIAQKDINKLKKKLKEIPEIKSIIVNYPSQGARVIDTHLF